MSGSASDALHVNLLSDSERVVHFYPEISNRTLDLRMSEQQLDSAEISGLAVDQRRFCPAERMRAVVGWIKPDHCDPFGNQARILTCRQRALLSPASGKEVVAGHLGVYTEISVDRLPGLLCDLEADRSAGLALAYGRSRTRVTIRSDIVDFEGDEIAAAQFAVDGEIEQREIADFPVQLQLGSD